jgi:hypothetical protein
MLDEILKYHQTPEDDKFVAGVIKDVKRQQRLRKLILTTTGLTGAAFGSVGVLMIFDGVSRYITDANLLPASVALVGLAAFMLWLFQDEVTAVS